jgi:hypothetical protein
MTTSRLVHATGLGTAMSGLGRFASASVPPKARSI